jgi:hypothetical protein
MGVRLPSVFAVTLAGVTINTNVETLALTTPPISPSLAGATVLLQWYARVIPGTNATGTTFLLRRGGAGGTLLNLVADADNALNAANLQGMRGGCYIDQPGDVAGVTYSLTVQCPGATVNGTVRDACLIAMVL